VVTVLIAAIVAMVISIVAGPRFINFLRLREYGQQIREEGPAGHVVKQGTPTMGGLLIIFSAAVPYLILSKYSTPALTVFFCMVGCGTIGFLDDFVKLTHRRSLGLNGRWKLLLLAVITGVVAWVAYHRDFSTHLYLPGVSVPLSWAWYPFLFLIIAGAANGVNLTDGIDGLAAGTGIIAVFTFTAMTIIA
jgi:phospho-N-acetylmuramoyl-pentapeptide-transferase